MSHPHAPLSEAEKERLYREATRGKTQGQIAGLLDCSGDYSALTRLGQVLHCKAYFHLR